VQRLASRVNVLHFAALSKNYLRKSCSDRPARVIVYESFRDPHHF
jgi:hypothetical protein